MPSGWSANRNLSVGICASSARIRSALRRKTFFRQLARALIFGLKLKQLLRVLLASVARAPLDFDVARVAGDMIRVWPAPRRRAPTGYGDPRRLRTEVSPWCFINLPAVFIGSHPHAAWYYTQTVGCLPPPASTALVAVS